VDDPLKSDTRDEPPHELATQGLGPAPARERAAYVRGWRARPDAVERESQEETGTWDESAEDGGGKLEIEKRVKVALEEAYPVFRDRLQRAHFADWHRRCGLDDDLANSAVLAVFRQCCNKHFIPGDIVGYLVTSARHIAIAAWKERRDGLVRFADLDRLPAKPGTRGSRRVIAHEETDNGTHADNGGTGQHQDELQEEYGNHSKPVSDRDVQEEESDDLVQSNPEIYIAEPTADNPSAVRELVRSAVDKLPRRQREAIEIYMRHKDEYTFAQMAAIMAPPISADGFEKNIERAMRSLRERLGSQELTRL